ncbi:fatty acid desaturase 2-like protein FADS2B isoform X3 [Myotis yumanensis]|uniref:fatty acid desaturase 2-like protein FADS2B isoform X3 n=1 Tax=Myotis yumanensis TaxID=159337 RepID=UPI0038D4DCB7
MIQSEVRIRSFRSQPRNLRVSVMMKIEEKLAGNGSLVGKSQLPLEEKHQANDKPEANGKAKVSPKQEADEKGDTSRKSLNLYSWQEIQRHNQETDQWLVINRKVYDVTSWADRHPGGRRVLNHYAGEDATDVFRAMHLELDIARLYLKPLLIGELAPGEPSQERNKNAQLVEDFQELRRTLEAMNMFSANLGFFSLHLIQILILEVLAWLMLWHFGNGWPITICISFLLTISQAQSSFLQHDTGHLSIFKKSKWNHLMHRFVMCHLKGLSVKWWNHRHFQHHTKPNIYPKDPDIDVGPLFLVGDLQPIKYGKKKIKYIDYEKQHLYFYMGHCLGQQFLHPLFHHIWPFLWDLRNSIAHIFGQVLATCNVEQSFFNDWFTGHLNFQIEHHLFPTMPRHNYQKVAPLVRSLCAKHGLQYVNKPILKAFGDIVRSLKKSAALWMDAYYET